MRALPSLLLAQHVCSSADWAVRDRRLVDSHGRERFFHGVNLIYKSAPYVPLLSNDGPLSFTRSDAALLQQLGMNGLRLGVMWGGVEPEPGKYNQSYVGELKKIVRMCEEFGIQVLLDFHQDSLSEAFCGEGIPWWAAHNYGPEYRQFPAPVDKAYNLVANSNFSGPYTYAKVPSPSDCAKIPYEDYMASYSMSRNYEDLYLNGRGLRDRFVSFWVYVSRQFKGDSNIIGLELMNEPATVWPRELTEEQFLQPLYDALEAAIHAVDPSRVLFFEPSCWDLGFPDTTQAVPTALTHAPGGDDFLNRSVLAYHYYDSDKRYHEAPYLDSRMQAAERLKVPGFVTEFELENVEHEGDEFDEHFGHVMDVMDMRLQSWLAWTYKGYDPTGYLAPGGYPFTAVCTGCDSGLLPGLPRSTEINWATGKAMARTYAQAVQGRTLSMQFDRRSSAFKLVYELDPELTAPTRIYVNRKLGGGVSSRYAGGVDVRVTIGLSWSLEGTVLLVSARPGLPRQEVSVSVSPKRRSEKEAELLRVVV